MNSTQLSALHTFINQGQPVVYEDVPDSLQDGDYVVERVQDPAECPRCGQGVVIVDNADDQFEVRCHRNHFENIPKSERLRYAPNFTKILETIADDLNLTVTGVDSSNLPRFARADTERGTLLYLIYGPRNYRDTVKQIYEDAIERGSPALLITPRGEITDIVELQFIFTVGHLVQAVPFTKLGEPDIIKQSLQTAEQFEDLSSDVMDQRFDSAPGERRERADTNPQYILSILSNIRMLRENGEIKPGSGDLLEDTAEAVFMHLFPTQPERGGEADSGQNLPDNVFYLWEDGSYKHIDYEPILGIVDTKSGSTANFAREPVDGKHDNYLDFARKHSFSAGAVAHIFVVLDVDGQQEIKFFDRIKDEYGENMYMVVLTLDALITIFAAYLSSVVSNELKLGSTSFTRAIYPLLHRNTYNANEHTDLRRQFRDVSRSADEYQRDLLERPDLMVITRETVLTRFRKIIEDDGEIEEILGRYFA
jgi:ribosomal protein S27AE